MWRKVAEITQSEINARTTNLDEMLHLLAKRAGCTIDSYKWTWCEREKGGLVDIYRWVEVPNERATDGNDSYKPSTS